MHKYFVFDRKAVDESECHHQAVRRFHSTGEESEIHFHKHDDPVDCEGAGCYVVPEPKEEESAD